MTCRLLMIGAVVWTLATLPDRAAAQPPAPSSSVPSAPPTSAPTSAPTPSLYPSTIPLTIDLVNFTLPIATDGTAIRYHIATPANVDPAAKKIRFYCSRIYEVRQVTEAAYTSCDGSQGVSTSQQACTEIGMYLEFTTVYFTTPRSIYFVSFTRSGDSNPSSSDSDGYCTEFGAKVQIDVVNMANQDAIDEYGCYRDSCPSTRDCFVSVCDWGSCRQEVPAQEGISCTDDNSFTSADQCNAAGQCAGMANYTFTLRVVPAEASSNYGWEQTGEIRNSHSYHLSDQILRLLTPEGMPDNYEPLPELDRTHFNFSVTEDVGLCTFEVINFREFSPYQLTDILAPLDGEEIRLVRGTFAVIIEAVTVSETPGGMLTTTTTGVSVITTTATTIAAGSDNSSEGDDNNVIAGVSLVVAAMIAGGVVLIGVICCCCKCCGGKKPKNTSLPGENGTINETQIDSATRDLLAGKVRAPVVVPATNPVPENYLDVESAPKPIRTLTFHSGRTDTVKKPPVLPGSKPPLSLDNDNYVDPDGLESKKVATVPPMQQEDYLDLSDNTAAGARKPKKSAPAPPPKAKKPAPAPPPKAKKPAAAMMPPSGQENYLDLEKSGPPQLPTAAPPPLPSGPPPM